jgi:HEPN domain-containing protein
MIISGSGSSKQKTIFVYQSMSLLRIKWLLTLYVFTCQQSVEKLLKAYLASKNIDFGKTHNLEFLLELCKKQDSIFENMNVGDLSFYAVEIRYPDEFYIPTVEEAKKCFKIASTAREFIMKELGSMRNV